MILREEAKRRESRGDTTRMEGKGEENKKEEARRKVGRQSGIEYKCGGILEECGALCCV